MTQKKPEEDGLLTRRLQSSNIFGDKKGGE